MSRSSTRGIAARLKERAPGTARRALDSAIGIVATVRTIGSFRRVPNPGEIEMVKQPDGTYAPPDSLFGTARERFRTERDNARRALLEVDQRVRGGIPDALEGDDDQDDDGIPDAR